MSDKGEVFAKLVHIATSKGIVVKFSPLPISKARLKGKLSCNTTGLTDYRGFQLQSCS